MTDGRKRPAARDTGLAAVEIVVVVAIIAILLAVSASGAMQTRAAANEAKAIQSLRVTFTAQRAYSRVCGAGAYAAGYLVLGQQLPGSEERFISMDLGGSAQPLKSGYRFTLTAGAGDTTGPVDCNGNPTVTNFYVTAIPLSVIGGTRSFAMNAEGVVWERPGGTAPTEPLGPPATPIR
jgi:type II secretory pathway pseudopilin PulG